jgi:hypothetical protein
MDITEAKRALNRVQDELPKAKMALKRATANLRYAKGGKPVSPALVAQTNRLIDKAQAEYNEAERIYASILATHKIAKEDYYTACTQSVATLAIVDEAEALTFIRRWLFKQPSPLMGVHRLIKLAWQAYREISI